MWFLGRIWPVWSILGLAGRFRLAWAGLAVSAGPVSRPCDWPRQPRSSPHLWAPAGPDLWRGSKPGWAGLAAARLGWCAPVPAWASVRRVQVLSGWASAGQNPGWASFPPVLAGPPPLPSQLGWRPESRLGLCTGPVAHQASLQAGYSLRSLSGAQVARPCLGQGRGNAARVFAVRNRSQV
jgi:hypothetical protein